MSSSTTSTDSSPTISPLSSIMYFIILTLIYLFVSISVLLSKKNIDQIKDSFNNKTFLLIYILFLLLGLYTINLKLSTDICPESPIDYNTVVFVTLTPWIIIFGTLFFLLNIFDGWIRPFSNTIGYLVVKLLGVEQTIDKLLKKEGADAANLTTVFKKINNNKSKFINEYNLEEFNEFTKQLKDDKIFKEDSELDTNDNLIQFYKFLCIKNFIGKILWYILAGILICSISFNYIINKTCTVSAESNVEKINELYGS